MQKATHEDWLQRAGVMFVFSVDCFLEVAESLTYEHGGGGGGGGATLNKGDEGDQNHVNGMCLQNEPHSPWTTYLTRVQQFHGRNQDMWEETTWQAAALVPH
jgi:hypothetical protein